MNAIDNGRKHELVKAMIAAGWKAEEIAAGLPVVVAAMDSLGGRSVAVSDMRERHIYEIAKRIAPYLNDKTLVPYEANDRVG